MKVLPATPGRDVAIFTVADQNASAISPPYPVEYAGDGSRRIGAPASQKPAK